MVEMPLPRPIPSITLSLNNHIHTLYGQLYCLFTYTLHLYPLYNSTFTSLLLPLISNILLYSLLFLCSIPSTSIAHSLFPFLPFPPSLLILLTFLSILLGTLLLSHFFPFPPFPLLFTHPLSFSLLINIVCLFLKLRILLILFHSLLHSCSYSLLVSSLLIHLCPHPFTNTLQTFLYLVHHLFNSLVHFQLMNYFPQLH